MSDSNLGPSVNADGATCRLRPSPTAAAVRLDGLRARDAQSLEALIAQLPPPPWDVDVAAEDPLVGLLEGAGFERYAHGTFFVRSIEGLPQPEPEGVFRLVDYENTMARPFTLAEAEALEGTAALREMGSPSGYEWGEGHGAFVVAFHRAGALVGFAHADLPDGTVDWFGVIPERRRRGVGRALMLSLAERVREANGTHLLAFAEDGTGAAEFLTAMGFRSKGRRTLLIRREDS